ncbi:MAG: 50S ribosomal protein L25, partial [Candidatus Gracilibacteria bacterium]|nr:50S ribosomal protein L25 [Candidatus Gracilibacteria bacterium]
AVKMLAGIVYGHKQEPIKVKMDYSSFLKTFRISGKNHVITLDFGKNKIDTIVHDIQKEPVSGDFSHIDFLAIVKGEKINTNIPLSFIGDSAAAKEGAILEEYIKEIEVKCQPTDLVNNFEVDLSKLEKIGDIIRVEDLIIDTNKFTVITEGHSVIVVASQPKVQKEEEEETTVSATEVPASEQTTEEK